MSKVIMSLDQSSTNSGIAIAELNNKNDDWKLIHHSTYKPRGNTFDEKMLNLCDYLNELIQQYNIELLLIEDIYNLRSISTTTKLANLQGAIKELSNINNIEYLVIHPSSWHQLLLTKSRKRNDLKNASKQFVGAKFGLTDLNDDECDAICILTYYLMKEEQM